MTRRLLILTGVGVTVSVASWCGFVLWAWQKLSGKPKFGGGWDDLEFSPICSDECDCCTEDHHLIGLGYGGKCMACGITAPRSAP